ncbi:conserved hypothetical protein [Cupriavidus taiwanensis]|uniref:Uncharacterized protein n=1 Tax=Cupriavidus taiwanensis TaxID=164546 RepID=A0A976B3K3_9BURK|nr:hypothetical protein [Cupriavidus taiwanensis]SOZ19334.1 conserved hypothetical protein [Cupriavidus taiwanensis]SOZ32529.1 conserved hypothetical protein [Cupriavidus taiwanensis]SOZ48111.1 conserved hypothetical protein [Cupriavidus taiwanensis]SOZ69533.1 conserved hypothetical protein [Cupriavidus taiwanensis]SOZ70274.1 conserved hypothetical protein [Cupriavidus taiwanensis]
MKRKITDDVMAIQSRYREWVLDGGKDAARGEALLHELKISLAALFQVPGELTVLRQAKGSAGLELTVLRPE